MIKPAVNDQIQQLLESKLLSLERELKGDVISYTGPIKDGNENVLLNIVEDLVSDETKSNVVYVILTTGGGSATAVERYVNILRKHYEKVSFIIPDYAYSAGTIFCMSGDKIFMDYFSVLGPIDPQIQNREGKLVPALGYLDKINELIVKAQKNELTQAEFLILKDFDLAELRAYEQAKELTMELLKKWLVKYKFKNWDEHSSTKAKVSPEEKVARAQSIADMLSNNNHWKSHGRPIDIVTLTNDLRLKIEDFSEMEPLRSLIRAYYELLSDYIKHTGANIFVQTRKFI